MKQLSLLFTLAVLAACGREEAVKPVVFKKPIVIQLPFEDSAQYRSYDYMNGSYPEFIGKSPFSDTLTITVEGRLQYEDSDIVFPELIGTTDTTRTDGLELFIDYSSSIVRNPYGQELAEYNYPVYIVNQTAGIKVISGKDNHLFGIQEALDSNGNWRPIEFKGYDFCGLGRFGLKLYPNEYALLAFPKYHGNFKTKLRVRIKNGDNVYVSHPFDGTINERQFYLKKDEYLHKALLKHKAEIIENTFYGAWPMEATDAFAFE
ncbi:MAG: hypothetical protein HUU01_12455 [Saprospiraceae bacterium]|nr:hypothetical protein [Saprospiraceae bacterium]